METDGVQIPRRRRKANYLEPQSPEPQSRIYPPRERAERITSSLQTDGFLVDEDYFDQRPPIPTSSTIRMGPSRTRQLSTRPNWKIAVPPPNLVPYHPISEKLKEVLSQAVWFVPYAVGVIVILYFLLQGLWLGIQWLGHILANFWPFLAKSDVIPPLANIAGIIQGMSVIIGGVFVVVRFFRKREKRKPAERQAIRF